MKLGETVSAVRSNRVLVGDQVRPAVILIQDGKVQRILEHADLPQDAACEVGSAWRFYIGWGHVTCWIFMWGLILRLLLFGVGDRPKPAKRSDFKGTNMKPKLMTGDGGSAL